jgi:hypothetical protein
VIDHQIESYTYGPYPGLYTEFLLIIIIGYVVVMLNSDASRPRRILAIDEVALL